MRTAKRNIFFFAGFTAGMFLNMMIVNYIIDPFCIFHKPIFKNPVYPPSEVYMNLGQIETFLKKTDDYDTILIGTSHTENFYANEITECLGSKGTLKLCLSGGFPVELETLARKALNTGKVKHVLYGFELSTFIYKAYAPHPQRTFPYNIYQNKYVMLPNAQMFKTSMRMILYQWCPFKFNWRTHCNLDDLYYYHDMPNIQQAHTGFIGKYSLDNLRHRFKKCNKTLRLNTPTDFSAIDAHLLPLIKDYQDVTFNVLIIPYSWAYFSDQPQTEKIFATQTHLVHQTEQYPNVRLYGFHTCKFPHNLANYYNETHYHPDINRYMLYSIKHNLHRITTDNFQQYEQEMLKQLQEFAVKDTYPHRDTLEECIISTKIK